MITRIGGYQIRLRVFPESALRLRNVALVDSPQCFIAYLIFMASIREERHFLASMMALVESVIRPRTCCSFVSDTFCSTCGVLRIQPTATIRLLRETAPFSFSLGVRSLISRETGGKELFLSSCKFSFRHPVGLERFILSLLNGLQTHRYQHQPILRFMLAGSGTYLRLLLARVPSCRQVFLILLQTNHLRKTAARILHISAPLH
jgi:hypothetical protein